MRENNNYMIFYWTINEEDQIRELILKGVDGIITDYPNRVQQVLEELKG